MSELYGKSGKSFTRAKRNMRRLSPTAFKGSITSNRYNERFPTKDRFLKRQNSVQSSVSTSKRPRLNEAPETPFTSALSGVDPLFAAATAAAVMNASFRPAPPAVDFSTFSGRSNTSTGAAMTAIAAAAMNAAALAAALGSPVTGASTDAFSSKRLYSQLSRMYKSNDMTYSAIADNRVGKSRPRLTRQLHYDTNSTRRYNSRCEKKTSTSVADRLPHHLENHSVATRTLFIGNLVQDITDEELRRVFGRYGHIEDIDIKRPEPGSRVNAYAFVRFVNLDVAHSAKMGMSGKSIRKFTCKIGYGKVKPTRCLWIGGLGSWMSYSTFTTLLDRFGKPDRISWPYGKSFAHVLYPTVDLAVTTADALRRYSPDGVDRKLRVDFTDENIDTAIPHRHQSANTSRNRSQRSMSRDGQSTRSVKKPAYSDEIVKRGTHTINGHYKQSGNDRNQRPSSPYRSPTKAVLTSRRSDHLTGYVSSSKKIQRSFGSESPSFTSKASLKSPDSPIPRKPSITPPDHIGDGTNKADIPLTLSTVTNTDDLSTCLSKYWNGTFYLKSSCFPCRMHMLRGDLSLVGQFMTNHKNCVNEKSSQLNSISIKSDQDALGRTNELVCLRITQRMKLDPLKLEDVSQRINAAGNSGFCVLLAVPPPSRTASCQSLDYLKQPYRPLRNLISYLRTKDSAGVVLLSPQHQSGLSTTTVDGLPITGVLHAFPPCDFAFNMLKETAVRLQGELTKDDHLVVLLIRSTGTV